MIATESLRAATASSGPRRIDRWVGLTALLGLYLLCAFIWAPRLPMVDLPQHAAQLAIWLRLADPSFHDTARYALNLRTPYLSAYVVARVLAGGVGVVPALKIVVWLSLVGHALAFAVLVRKLGHAPALVLLGLPFALGYSFYFGFLAFNAALPFGILSLAAALDHCAYATLRTGVKLGLLLCLTLVSHGFLLGMTVVCILPLLMRGAHRADGAAWSSASVAAAKRLAPLVAPALLAVIWLGPGSSARSIGATLWEPRLLDLMQIPALLLASSGADHWASWLGVAMLTWLVLSCGRPVREPARLLPVVLMLLGYCLFPISLSGFTPLHPRFAAFIVPTALLALQPRPAPLTPKLPGLIAITTFAWLGLFTWRLRDFERETQPIADFVQRMPGGLRVRPLVFEATSRVYPALPVLMHLSAYYAAEKGGRQGYSFAMYPTSVIRYAASVTPMMLGGAEWHPEWFSPRDELEKYDCFLVHSEHDRAAAVFAERLPEVRLAFHERDWWAYMTHSNPNADAYQETAHHGATVASRDFN